MALIYFFLKKAIPNVYLSPFCVASLESRWSPPRHSSFSPSANFAHAALRLAISSLCLLLANLRTQRCCFALLQISYAKSCCLRVELNDLKGGLVVAANRSLMPEGVGRWICAKIFSSKSNRLSFRKAEKAPRLNGASESDTTLWNKGQGWIARGIDWSLGRERVCEISYGIDCFDCFV